MFCKGPVVMETLPANALYHNSIPLLFSWLILNVCNCCVITWFIVGELCLVAPLSREQSYMGPQYPSFPVARHNIDDWEVCHRRVESKMSGYF
jgi:hypothetical protein